MGVIVPDTETEKTLTLDRDSTNDLVFDSTTGQYISATPITYPPFPLYAWTTASTTLNFPETFYTDTETPTSSSKIYDASGNELDVANFAPNGSGRINSTSASSIIMYYNTLH